MTGVIKIMQMFFILAMFTTNIAQADDNQEIIQLIQNLYGENEEQLTCIDSRGELDEKLIAVSEKYLSINFMKLYKLACTREVTYQGDPRTGQSYSVIDAGTKLGFTNLNIEQPKARGSNANVRSTYDLPDLSYKNYGNFTFFTLIKENGQWKIDDIELGGHDMDKYNEREDKSGMKPIKSLKRLIKKEMEIQNKKKKV